MYYKNNIVKIQATFLEKSFILHVYFVPAHELFFERVNTFKPENQTLG